MSTKQSEKPTHVSRKTRKWVIVLNQLDLYLLNKICPLSQRKVQQKLSSLSLFRLCNELKDSLYWKNTL
jgi:hypothetical protein